MCSHFVCPVATRGHALISGGTPQCESVWHASTRIARTAVDQNDVQSNQKRFAIFSQGWRVRFKHQMTCMDSSGCRALPYYACRFGHPTDVAGQAVAAAGMLCSSYTRSSRVHSQQGTPSRRSHSCSRLRGDIRGHIWAPGQTPDEVHPRNMVGSLCQ